VVTSVFCLAARKLQRACGPHTFRAAAPVELILWASFQASWWPQTVSGRAPVCVKTLCFGRPICKSDPISTSGSTGALKLVCSLSTPSLRPVCGHSAGQWSAFVGFPGKRRHLLPLAVRWALRWGSGGSLGAEQAREEFLFLFVRGQKLTTASCGRPEGTCSRRLAVEMAQKHCRLAAD